MKRVDGLTMRGYHYTYWERTDRTTTARGHAGDQYVESLPLQPDGTRRWPDMVDAYRSMVERRPVTVEYLRSLPPFKPTWHVPTPEQNAAYELDVRRRKAIERSV